MNDSLKRLKSYLNRQGELKLIAMEPSSYVLAMILRSIHDHVVMCSVGTCSIALKTIEVEKILSFEGFRDLFIKMIRLMKQNKNILVYYVNDLMYTEKNIEVKLKGYIVSTWLLHRYAHQNGKSVILIGYKTAEGRLPYSDYIRPWADTLIEIKEEKVGNRRIGWRVLIEKEEIKEIFIGDVHG